MLNSTLLCRLLFILAAAAVVAAFEATNPHLTQPQHHTTPSKIPKTHKLTNFINRHCRTPYRKTMRNSDKTICDILKSGNVEDLKSFLECNICTDPLRSATLATTRCGHVSHQTCRFKVIGDQCHFCRKEGPHRRLNRGTVLREALVLFEEMGWTKPASPEEINDQKQERYSGRLRKKFTEAAGYTFATLVHDFESVDGLDDLIRTSGGLIDTMREKFEGGTKALTICAKNIVWRLDEERDMKRTKDRLLSIVRGMELNFDLGRGVYLTRPDDDVRAWMLDFGRALNALLNEALPPPTSDEAALDRRRSVLWLSRYVVFGKIMSVFPCEGHIPGKEIIGNHVKEYFDFLKKYLPPAEAPALQLEAVDGGNDHNHAEEPDLGEGDHVENSLNDNHRGDPDGNDFSQSDQEDLARWWIELDDRRRDPDSNDLSPSDQDDSDRWEEVERDLEQWENEGDFEQWDAEDANANLPVAELIRYSDSSPEQTRPRRPVNTAYLRSSIVDALNRGRDLTRAIWSDTSVCLVPQKPDHRTFVSERDLRDDHVSRLNKALPYLFLPAAQHAALVDLLARNDTTTCGSAVRGLTRLSETLFDGLVASVKYEGLGKHLRDWNQLLDGLNRLLFVSRFMIDPKPMKVSAAKRRFRGAVKTASANLGSRMDVEYLRNA